MRAHSSSIAQRQLSRRCGAATACVCCSGARALWPTTSSPRHSQARAGPRSSPSTSRGASRSRSWRRPRAPSPEPSPQRPPSSCQTRRARPRTPAARPPPARPPLVSSHAPSASRPPQQPRSQSPVARAQTRHEETVWCALRRCPTSRSPAQSQRYRRLFVPQPRSSSSHGARSSRRVAA